MMYEIATYTQQVPGGYVQKRLPGGRVKVAPDPAAPTGTEHVADVFMDGRRVSTHIAATSSEAMSAAQRWCDTRPVPKPTGRIQYSPR